MKLSQTTLTWENLDAYLKVPLGYRFVDKVQLVSDREALGTKAVSSQDWYFRIHFPGNPVMPGVFIMESIEQTAIALLAVAGKQYRFQACEAMRLFGSVRPGDILQSYVNITEEESPRVQCEGEAYIQQADGSQQKICSMRFTLISEEVTSAGIAGDISAGETVPEIPAKNVAVDFDNFDQYIAVPLEYRFLDKAKVVPPKAAWGMKNISSQEWYFPIACCNRPVVPHAVVMEVIMQTGALSATTIDNGRFKLMMYNSCRKMQLYGQALPGACIRTYVELRRFRNGVANLHGMAYADDQLLCRMDFILVAPGEMRQVRR